MAYRRSRAQSTRKTQPNIRSKSVRSVSNKVHPEPKPEKDSGPDGDEQETEDHRFSMQSTRSSDYDELRRSTAFTVKSKDSMDLEVQSEGGKIPRDMNEDVYLFLHGLGPPRMQGERMKGWAFYDIFRAFWNTLRLKSKRPERWSHGLQKSDVGDEDEGIFVENVKKAHSGWNSSKVLSAMLITYVVIDYLHAWYEHGQYVLIAAEEEYAYKQHIYNCRKVGTRNGIGDQILEIVRFVNAFLSFLVLFVTNEQNAPICACWMVGRWVLELMRCFKYFWLIRPIKDEYLFKIFTIKLISLIVFDAFGMFLVCFIYYEYTGILKTRVNRLRGGRILNHEIEAKQMDEFSQKKAAMRFAATYQSALLIKKQIREAGERENGKLQDPKPEECKFAMQAGLKAYKYYRGVKSLKMDEKGHQLQKKVHERERKRAKEMLAREASILAKTPSPSTNEAPAKEKEKVKEEKIAKKLSKQGS